MGLALRSFEMYFCDECQDYGWDEPEDEYLSNMLLKIDEEHPPAKYWRRENHDEYLAKLRVYRGERRKRLGKLCVLLSVNYEIVALCRECLSKLAGELEELERKEQGV